MNKPLSNKIIEEVVSKIEIPDSAYQKAEQRYKDLGDWFDRPESRCNRFDPQIYPQGSFRMGTVIRPLKVNDEYDLDLGCRLRQGITKGSHTQEQVKHLVGSDLQDYRDARGIKDALEEKQRCWRLNYADTLKFHMDTVPSIPEDQLQRGFIKQAMVNAGTSTDLASKVSELTGAITDNTSPSYHVISSNWHISNSEGLALWFQSRMKLAAELMEKRAFEARNIGIKAAQVDDLPIYRWKSPLQRCVQLLKRHRDVRYAKNSDSKPISVIITTLAARAYAGQVDIVDALDHILKTMGAFVNQIRPRVPNPVHPAEDFADKWYCEEHKHLKLEENFWSWLRQANLDFQALINAQSAEDLVRYAQDCFCVSLNVDDVRKKFGFGGPGSLLKPAVVPGVLSFPPKPVVPTKPAGFACGR